MYEPIAARLAVRMTGDLARSALPDAPVRHGAERVRAARLRRWSSHALRRLADRLEPAPRLSARTS